MKIKISKNMQCKGLLRLGFPSLQEEGSILDLPDKDEAQDLANRLIKEKFAKKVIIEKPKVGRPKNEK